MNQPIKTPAEDTAIAPGAFAQSTVVPIDSEPLVMGVPRSKSPVRFRVSIDGQPPGPAHGLDVDEGGNGTIVEQRLYQLIRQSKPTVDRTFEMEFLDARRGDVRFHVRLTVMLARKRSLNSSLRSAKTASLEPTGANSLDPRSV